MRFLLLCFLLCFPEKRPVTYRSVLINSFLNVKCLHGYICRGLEDLTLIFSYLTVSNEIPTAVNDLLNLCSLIIYFILDLFTEENKHKKLYYI